MRSNACILVRRVLAISKSVRILNPTCQTLSDEHVKTLSDEYLVFIYEAHAKCILSDLLCGDRYVIQSD